MTSPLTLSDGQTFSGGIASITASGTASWHDGKYVDYYYGVRADEARPPVRA
ncbi:MipA/OmpV family protein [Massilia timonae]|uniref:MipA/OmpV family protein n=1 Tax=Massilia timonae TaxID=47229 RepID=UPI0012FBB46D